MEFLLLWWDDLDDLAHACRHLATSAFSEVAESTATVASSVAAVAAAVLMRVQS